MSSKEKENNFAEVYVQYFKKHHNAVYFGLGILFLLQIIIFASTTFQINEMGKSNTILKDNIVDLTYSINQSFSNVNNILSEHTMIQGEMIKDLEILKLSKDFTAKAARLNKLPSYPQIV